MDDLVVDGKTYISSKRAAEKSGYAQDYIGQLARKGLIDARRIGGLWYVQMPSLEAYEKEGELKKIESPAYEPAPEPESLVFFDGKDYISASRASKITGYNQDYVGQLARSGQIVARQVGNRWYVERTSVLDHKEEKDALLAAVQASSVGLGASATGVPPRPAFAPEPDELLKYTTESHDLMPLLHKSETNERDRTYVPSYGHDEVSQKDSDRVSIPIKKLLKTKENKLFLAHGEQIEENRTPLLVAPRTAYLGLLSAAALTVVVVVTFGYGSLKNGSIYSSAPKQSSVMTGSAARAASAFDRFLDMVEDILSPKVKYTRQ